MKLFKNIDFELASLVEFDEFSFVNRIGLEYEKRNMKIYSHFQIVDVKKLSSTQLMMHKNIIRLGFVYNFFIR